MNNSRREFFKQALGAVGLAVAAPALLKSVWPSVALAQTPAAGGAAPYVVPGVGMAASVGYVEDKKKVEKSLAIPRNGVKWSEQHCGNCVLFTKNATGTDGKCALFSGQTVKSTSWCKSWSKKPS